MRGLKPALLAIAAVAAVCCGWYIFTMSGSNSAGKTPQEKAHKKAARRTGPGVLHSSALPADGGRREGPGTAGSKPGPGEGAQPESEQGKRSEQVKAGDEKARHHDEKAPAMSSGSEAMQLDMPGGKAGEEAAQAGGPECRSHMQCIDENPCIRGACVNGKCESHMIPDCHTCDRDADCPGAPALCEAYGCDVASGLCVLAPKKCDDGVRCTTDYCDPTTGQCVHEGECCFSIGDCDDSDPCTEDICDKEANKCRYEIADCDDGNPCTQDWCEPFKGCSYETAPGCDKKCAKNSDCLDASQCTTDECNLPEGLCAHTAIPCEDGDWCTQDFCDPEQGCLHVRSKGCDGCKSDSDCPPPAGNLCVNAVCDPAEGKCSYAQKSCDDGDDCTEDYCVPESGKCATSHVCCTDDTDCDQSNKCSKVTCAAGKCQVEPLKCDDGNECTLDSCDTDVGCVHERREGCKRHYEKPGH